MVDVRLRAHGPVARGRGEFAAAFNLPALGHAREMYRQTGYRRPALGHNGKSSREAGRRLPFATHSHLLFPEIDTETQMLMHHKRRSHAHFLPVRHIVLFG